MPDLLDSLNPLPHHTALIFDCDGTLADTMPAHFEAWLVIMQRWDLSFSEDQFYAMGGWPTRKIFEMLAAETGRDLDPDALAIEKEDEFLKMIDHVQPIQPVANIVRTHKDQMPIAVGTGAVRSICEMILRQIGLEGAFRTIVASEDVARHKPEPEVYLEAARRLEVDPATCLVYEDTDPGIESAHRAGMDCVDIRQFHTPRRVT
jgi:beta-phosphoglucomutase family hydrolase